MNYVASAQTELGDIKDQVTKDQDFFFSYQSSLINLDKTIKVPSYEAMFQASFGYYWLRNLVSRNMMNRLSLSMFQGNKRANLIRIRWN